MQDQNKLTSDTLMRKVEAYWIGKEQELPFNCPNLSLFRLIGGTLGSVDNKRVLEIGFGHGADLVECNRRGADVFGLDLNPKYVENIKSSYQFDVRQFRAGFDEIPFDGKFDLIYSRDTIYYLSDANLSQLFEQCVQKIADNGTLIVQFIETDLKLSESATKNTHNFDINFLSHYVPHRIHGDVNPIRFLKADDVIENAKNNNFKLVGTKRMIQSYDLHESEFRVDKYLVFMKY